MSISRPRRLDFGNRVHAFAFAALLEVLLLGLIFAFSPMLVGADSILLLCLVVLVAQFPTSLLAIGVLLVIEGHVEMSTTFAICAVVLYLGQTAFLGWWLNFKERKAKCDPSAV